MKSFTSVVLLLFVTGWASAESYLLKYKFNEGDVIRTKVVHLVTVETKIKGTSQTAQSRSSSVKNWTIESINDNGDATFVHSVENIDMWQKVTDRPEQTYNSDSDTIPPAVYNQAAKSVGIPLTKLTINNRGKILEREILGGTPTIEVKILTVMHDEPVKIGDVWHTTEHITVRTSDGNHKKIKIRQMSQLLSVAGGIATISTQAQVLTPIDDPAIKVELIQKLSKGKVRFDLDKGMIVERQFDLNERVMGFQGDDSMMNYVGRMTETVLTEEVKTANKSDSLPK